MNNYEKLKQRHPMRRDIILIIVLLLLILVAIIFPRFKELHEPVEKTEIIYIEPEKKTPLIGNPPPKPDIVGSLLKEMDEKPIPPEFIESVIDFEWPVLDTFSLDSLYKYEPKIEGPPPPSKNSWQTGGCPIYDKQPKPVGGRETLYKNLVYPSAARQAGIEGTVLVQCFINEEGEIEKCIIMKGMPETGFDEAAIEAISKTKWEPAIQRKKAVGVWIAIPVMFKLNK